MTEAVIRKKAKAILEKEGYVVWCPAKAKYQETDVFGIYDALALKDSDIRFIQWTTTSNMSARKKKIQNFFTETNTFLPSEIWGCRPDGTFKIEYL